MSAAVLASMRGIGAETVAVFLGSIGDHTAREVLKVAGLALVKQSSGVR